MTPEQVRARRAKLWRMESHPGTPEKEKSVARSARQRLEQENPWLQKERLHGDLIDDVQTAKSDWEWVVRQGISPEAVHRYMSSIGERLLDGFWQTVLSEMQEAVSPIEESAIEIDPICTHSYQDESTFTFNMQLGKESILRLKYGCLDASEKEAVLQAITGHIAEHMSIAFTETIWK